MKAVLWIRTSSDRQEIDSMTDELYSFAAKHGYGRNDCIVIGRRGASAIKADEAYKEEIDKLYKELDTGKYNCLFAWELSRIGRKEEYVMELKNYLIDHKIQLRIMKPSLYLLEDDGSVNAGMELSLTLLTTLAKQEMTIKKERMQRGKKRIKHEGKFAGAPCPRYGYRVGKNGLIEEDPVDGGHVREMFDMYLNRGMSANAIYKDFNSRGIFRDYSDITAGTTKVLRILKSKAYAGLPDRGHMYPAIVTERMVEKCIARAAASKAKPKTSTKNTYYCKGVMECGDCGYMMIPMRNNVTYTCTKHGHKNAVNINVLDYVAWEIAKIYKPYAMKHRTEESLREYERLSRSEWEKMQEAMTKKLMLGKKYEKLNDVYIDGNITKMKYEQKLSEFAQERRKLDEGITDHLNRHEAAERLKKGILEDSFDISTVEDDELRRKYVAETMKIRVSRVGGEYGHYRIDIVPRLPVPRKDWFDYQVRGHFITLTHYVESGGNVTRELWSGWTERFQRYS